MLPGGVKIFAARHPTDLRKSIDGLALLTQDVIKQDPMSGHLFLFINKVGHRVKILFWDRTGYVIWYKRLESARIRLPGCRHRREVQPISSLNDAATSTSWIFFPVPLLKVGFSSRAAGARFFFVVAA
jgi:transposase